jgi:hypothetical protein
VEAVIRLRHLGDEVPDVRPVAHFGHVATGRIPAEAVRAVRHHRAVASMKAARTLVPDLRRDGGSGLPHCAGDIRRPRATRPTGPGVVVGVVDRG